MSGTGDDDDGGGSGHTNPLVVIAKNPKTGRYANFTQEHLDMNHPDVKAKLNYLNGEDD